MLVDLHAFFESAVVTFSVYQNSVLFDFRPEYAKYSSDEEDEDDGLLGEPFVKERELDEQEIDKVGGSICLWRFPKEILSRLR